MNDIDRNLAELDKDQPLKEDIRLLGRLLGDTLREQEGEQHLRADRADPPARHPLPPGRRRAGARASWPACWIVLSPRGQRGRDPRLHLLLAARQHRRGPAITTAGAALRQLTGAPAPEGSLALALARAGEAGHGAGAVAEFFRDALMSPVLTAHPTEVQRKSILDCQLRHRAAAHRARPPRADAGGAVRQRGGAAARRS